MHFLLSTTTIVTTLHSTSVAEHKMIPNTHTLICSPYPSYLLQQLFAVHLMIGLELHVLLFARQPQSQLQILQ